MKTSTCHKKTNTSEDKHMKQKVTNSLSCEVLICLSKVWEGIDSLLGRQNKVHKDISYLKYPRTKQVSHNFSHFPNIMNKYFFLSWLQFGF